MILKNLKKILKNMNIPHQNINRLVKVSCYILWDFFISVFRKFFLTFILFLKYFSQMSDFIWKDRILFLLDPFTTSFPKILKLNLFRMDAIKKKMTKLSAETTTATARANRFEEESLNIGRSPCYRWESLNMVCSL